MRHYTMHIYATYILLYYERDYPKDVIETREDVSEAMTFKLKVKGQTGCNYMQSGGGEKASRGNSLHKVTNSRKKLGVGDVSDGLHYIPSALLCFSHSCGGWSL